MNAATWVSIYMPLFILFFIIFPQQRALRNAVLLKIRRRKGVINMTNEMIKKYIGKNCHISTGSFGISIVGEIIEVNEKWIEVRTKKGNQLVNSEFIQNIKIRSS
ncbi:DUF6897 domain-containing protein [Wukongibacter baidiensis]